MEGAILYKCNIPSCPFEYYGTSRAQLRHHLDGHAQGKHYCVDCNIFLLTTNKHWKTPTHKKKAEQRLLNATPEHLGMDTTQCTLSCNVLMYYIARIQTIVTIAQENQQQQQVANSQIYKPPSIEHLQPNHNPPVHPNVVQEPPAPQIDPIQFDVISRAVDLEEELLTKFSEDLEALDDDNQNKSNQKPELWQLYKNVHSLSFMYVCTMQLGIGRTSIEKLLRLLHNPNFDMAAVAPSFYLLKRVEDATIPKIVRSPPPLSL